MTETQSAYDELDYICPNCRVKIGRLVEVKLREHFGIKKRVRLQCGDFILMQANGNCAKCGHQIDFSETAKTLERLIERIKENRIENG